MTPMPEPSTPLCPDCGEAMDRHCVVWPHDGDMFLQCPVPRTQDDPDA